MRVLLIALAGLVVSSVFAAVLTGWNHEEDELLVRAVSNLDASDVHQVTKTTYKMSPPAATMCMSVPLPTGHDPHKEYYCHVFVNQLALKPMNTGEGTYPEGALIIKQKFSDKRGTKTELFTVMRKMKQGYDEENGDWEYSIIDAAGETVLSRGRTDSCIECHTEYEDSDYVSRLYMAGKGN